MTLAIISHADCALHDAGANHPEQPARVVVVQEALQSYPFQPPAQFFEAPLATKAQLVRAHDPDYIDWIHDIAPDDGLIALDNDTLMNPHTLNAALRAAGSVILAVDLVMSGKVNVAFCNIRPPGHHAENDKAMGFCIFNNVAVGIAHARAQYGIRRVAVIDFDVHHGNGTQAIFQEDEAVLYCSSFEHPFYPGYEPALDNAHLLSVPLPPGTRGEAFRERVSAAWFAALRDFQPELIFFSAGFDAHAQDPLADFFLTEADFIWLTTEIASIAKESANGRMISVLEGGYSLEALVRTVPLHVAAMAS